MQINISLKPLNNLQSYYESISETPAWRHTIGRLSCAARLPIYTVGFALQSGKTLAKFIICPLPTVFNIGATVAKLDKWKFDKAFTVEGALKDSLITISLCDTIINTAMGVIFAPPKDYHSFSEALTRIDDVVLDGEYHGHSLKEVYDRTFKQRPHYSKIIFQNESITSSARWSNIRHSICEYVTGDVKAG